MTSYVSNGSSLKQTLCGQRNSEGAVMHWPVASTHGWFKDC